MKKTKVVNQTGSSLILKEGTGGMYRTLCPELKDKNAFTIKVDTNATYREYWVTLLLDDGRHVVLSSDDCVEYEEVRIKLNNDGTYTWDALKRGSHELVKDAVDKEASKQRQTQSIPDPGPGFFSKALNKFKNWLP